MNQKFVYNDVTQEDIDKGIIRTLRKILSENNIEIANCDYDNNHEVLTLYVVDNLNRDQHILFELKCDTKKKAYEQISNNKISENVEYYDPEYDRIVDEDVIRKQYEYFSKQSWFDKTYEQFRDDNFTLLSNSIDRDISTYLDSKHK